MNPPSVTVLLPVYNGGAYLKEAIDSILLQTFKDFEFLIINDGSTDDTESIILSYTDPRIRYIKNETNLKLIATLNKGIKMARGAYIARMDADDIALPQRLEKQVEFMEMETDCVLCGTEAILIGRENEVPLKSPGDNIKIKCLLFFNNYIIHPTVMLRKATLINKGLFYPKEALHSEDFALWINLRKHGTFNVIPEPLLKYRDHDMSISQSNLQHQYDMVKQLRLSQLMCSLTLDEQKVYHCFINQATNDYYSSYEPNIKWNYQRLSLCRLVLNKIVKSFVEDDSGLSVDDFRNFINQTYCDFILSTRLDLANRLLLIFDVRFIKGDRSKLDKLTYILKSVDE
jgi:glycosyltransferase involved in cell wall biosynthesis